MRAWLPALLLALGACGRLGYAELRPLARDADGPGGADTGPSQMPDGQVAAADGGGTQSADAARPTMSDAQVSTGDAGSAEPSGDAGEALPTDGGTPALPRAPDGNLDCASITSLACESFAQGIPATMETRSFGGSVQSTAGAVETRSDAGQAKAALVVTFPALLSGELYVRFDMLLTSSVPLVGVNFLGITDSAEPWPYGEIDFNAIGGPRSELFLLESKMAYQSTAGFPLGVSTCVEVSIAIAEQTGSVQLSFDGQVAILRKGIDASLPMGIGRVSVGIDFTAETQGPASVLIDDLVVAQERYDGCK